jgi:hypothetical protein
MLLKHIYLYLNLDEYPDELATPFGFRTRYICNFLEKRLKPLKYQADGFSKICVQGKHVPEEACPIISENAVVPSVMFDQERYQMLDTDEHHEFFIGMLCEGIEKCARNHHIPLAAMMEAIEDFRRGGYKNEWIYQTKLLRPAGLRASLLCSLDTDRFVLTLQLERKGETIFMEPILETKPDEIIFEHRFKEVALADDSVVVKNKFGENIFSLELNALVLH